MVCITILLCMEVYLQNSYKEIGQMVLYCLVPYLVCMVALLRLIRLQKETEFTDMCDCNAGFLHLLGDVSKNIAMVI